MLIAKSSKETINDKFCIWRTRSGAVSASNLLSISCRFIWAK